MNFCALVQGKYFRDIQSQNGANLRHLKRLYACTSKHFGKRGLTDREEDAQAIKNLLAYLNENKTCTLIKDVYWSIVLAMQLYFRSDHWKGVVNLGKDFQGLFEHHLKGRFIRGSEGIAEICMCHGKDFSRSFPIGPSESIGMGNPLQPQDTFFLMKSV